MSRSRASAKAAGARFERAIADCLAEHVDDRIDRRVKGGAVDKGDLGGVRTHNGKRVVVEVKDHSGKYQVGPWLREADAERINDNAEVGVVIAKRRGVSDPLQQVVFMEVSDFIALINGERP